MTDFPLVQLGPLAKSERGAVAIGPFGSRMKADKYVSSGVPVVRGTNISGGRSFKGDWVYVTEEFASEIPNCIVKPGDLVFPHRGAIGEVALVEETSGQMVLSSSMMKFRPDPTKLDSHFAYYFFKSAIGRGEILRFGSQVGTPGIGQPLASLRQFRLPLPELATQSGIGRVLAALDDKIELNLRMNETLEAMAQAIFRDWFVDFGPVRRKMEGTTNPFAILGGLAPHGASAIELAALFPTSMGPSSIPSGCALSTIGEATSVLETGTRPKGGIKGITHGVPSVGAESITGLAQFDFGKTKFVPREFFASMKRGIVGTRDILLYKDGGRPGEFEPHVAMFGGGFPFEQCCINEHVYRLVARPPFSQEYLFFHLTSEGSMEEMRNKGTGVAIPGLNSTAARSLSILHPGASLLEAFTRFARPLVDKAINNSIETRTLADTRDYLLPRLMSGQVRVGELADLVETAT